MFQFANSNVNASFHVVFLDEKFDMNAFTRFVAYLWRIIIGFPFISFITIVLIVL